VSTVETLPLLLTPAEVAELFRTTVRGIYAMRDRGQIPGLKLGRRLLFKRDDVLGIIGLGESHPVALGRKG
jgi:excisionase family DNA binding protein